MVFSDHSMAIGVFFCFSPFLSSSFTSSVSVLSLNLNNENERMYAPLFIPEQGLQFDYKYLSIRESQKKQEPRLAGLKQI